MSYAPFFTYIFYFILAYYNRTLYHFFLWNGIVLNGLILIITGLTLPSTANNTAVCASRVENTPCSEVAIVSCVSSYILVCMNAKGSEATAPSPVHTSSNIAKCLFLFTYVCTTTISVILLSLANWEEVFVGLAVGVLCGLVTAFVAVYYVSPKTKHKHTKSVLEFLQVTNVDFLSK
jgi:hypothetical protein